MAQFIQNIIEAARTADQREDFTIYDIVGAFFVCVIILSFMFFSLVIGSNIG